MSLVSKLVPVLVAGFLGCLTPVSAWDGVDSSTGADVEIGKGNLVRSGRDIEVYDHSSGQYLDVTVESIRRFGGTVEVKVLDHDTGEVRVLEMEDD